MREAIGIVIVFAALGGMLLGARWLKSHYELSPELARKLVHVGMGCVTITFPWLFSSAWTVGCLALLAIAGLTALKNLPALRTYGEALYGIERRSSGDIYFALSSALVFALSEGDVLLYCIPIAILSLADAVAALIGVRYGQLRYNGADGTKSAEGSVAFFTVTFFTTHVPLLLLSEVGRAETLLIALILAILVMLLEAIAWQGLDNLFIPLGAFVMLKIYRDFTVNLLLVRLVVLLIMTATAFSWRKQTTLSNNGLTAAMLYAYTSFAIGGVTWLLPVLILFLSYAIVWPQSSRRDDDPHSSRSVMAVVSAGLAWLFLGHAFGEYGLIIPYSMSFAFHLAFIGIAWERSQPEAHVDSGRLSLSAMQGWAIIMLPCLLLHLGIFPLRVYPLSAACSLLAALCYGHLIPASAGADLEEFPWLRQALIAGIFSLPGALMI